MLSGGGILIFMMTDKKSIKSESCTSVFWQKIFCIKMIICIKISVTDPNCWG